MEPTDQTVQIFVQKNLVLERQFRLVQRFQDYEFKGAISIEHAGADSLDVVLPIEIESGFSYETSVGPVVGNKIKIESGDTLPTEVFIFQLAQRDLKQVFKYALHKVQRKKITAAYYGQKIEYEGGHPQPVLRQDVFSDGRFLVLARHQSCVIVGDHLFQTPIQLGYRIDKVLQLDAELGVDCIVSVVVSTRFSSSADNKVQLLKSDPEL